VTVRRAEARTAIVQQAIEGAQAVRAVLPQLKAQHAQALTGIKSPDAARAILSNPRFARRLAPLVGVVMGMPGEEPCPVELRPLLNEAFFRDCAVRIGLMFNLRRFGSIIMKRDLASFESVYGAGALDFALRHIAAAPATATQERIPAAAFDLAATRRAGTIALTHWAHARFGEQSRWLDAVMDMKPLTELNPRLVAVVDKVAADLGLSRT
jgi:hypothetical protein